MNPERAYLQLLSDLLKDIRLKSLALPKTPPPDEHMYLGYSYHKPHGVEFWIRPGTDYTLQRNMVYKLQEEGTLRVLDENRDEYGYDGTCFTVKLEDSFDKFYKLHEKGERISKKLENENYWVHANFENGEIHLMIGEKKNDEGEHVHLILGKTGEVRIDPGDQKPSTLLTQVLAITTKEGKTIKAELHFEETTEK